MRALTYSPTRLTVKREHWFRQYPQGIELVTEGTLAGNILSCVSPVQTIDTVDTENTGLIPSDVVVMVTIPSRFLITTLIHKKKI